MKRVLFAILGGLIVAVPAAAQETAKVDLTIKISAKTPSFKDQRLVAILHHNHPNQPDRGNVAVDSHINAKFSHRQGTETVVTVRLGAKAKLNPDVNYTVNVTVFDAASNCTHISELEDRTGPFPVLNGGADKLALTVRPAP